MGRIETNCVTYLICAVGGRLIIAWSGLEAMYMAVLPAGLGGMESHAIDTAVARSRSSKQTARHSACRTRMRAVLRSALGTMAGPSNC